MNILIVSQYFYPENFRINDLAEGMVKRGHRVTVLTGIPNYPDGRFFSGYGWFRRRRETWQGVDIVRAPLVARGKGGGLRLALNYVSFALFASVVGRRRLGRDYDVIFVFETSPVTVGIPAIVMKRLTGAPILFWILDLWPQSVSATTGIDAPWVLKPLSMLTRWIYRHCDRLLVQSRGFVAPVEAMGGERILYFPSWAEQLYRPLPRQALPVSLPKGFCVMIAGNIGAAQDFPAILAAAEQLKDQDDIHWIIVGDGRMANWVRGETKRRGLMSTVHLLGRYPIELMPGFFTHADALLVSLKKEHIFSLTIPGKIQSYLACGRPVIGVLDGEGARLIEEAKAGFTCGAGDSRGLAACVLDLYRMTPESRERLGANGRDYYLAHFEREKLFTRLEKWMSDMCAGKTIGRSAETVRSTEATVGHERN